MSTIIEYEASTYRIIFRIISDTADLYPKSTRARNYRLSGLVNGKVQLLHTGVMIDATLQADSINKGINEAGLKRLVSFVKTAKKIHGSISLERGTSFGNDIELPSFISELANN